MRNNVLCLAMLSLTACATTAPQMDGDDELRTREPAGTCDASAAQDTIGTRATAEIGAALIEATGARTLRWVPPRTAVTMDYRPDRLTVHYDDDMLIERITCG